MKRILGLWINGRWREEAVAENALLIDYLREGLGLTGTKQGCDGGECGACTVLVDGQPRLACSTLAHSVAGAPRRNRRGPRHRRQHLAPAARLPRKARHPVRLLHAGHDHGRRRPAAQATRIPGATRSRPPWPATCAAAPATSRSSNRWKPPPEPRHERARPRSRKSPTPPASEPHGVGARLPLVDGVEKVTGTARYTADLPADNALVGLLLRSPYAHAELLEVDISEALALPGVRAVITGDECDMPYGVIPIAQNEFPAGARQGALHRRPDRRRRRGRRSHGAPGDFPHPPEGARTAGLLQGRRRAPGRRRAAARKEAGQHRARGA
jgi:hypothetical protein